MDENIIQVSGGVGSGIGDGVSDLQCFAIHLSSFWEKGNGAGGGGGACGGLGS